MIVVPKSIDDNEGLSLMPSNTRLPFASQHKFELLHFDYVAQWEAFRGDVISKHLFSHKIRHYRGYSGFGPVLQLSIMVVCGC
jgi:hypothetical protein